MKKISKILVIIFTFILIGKPIDIKAMEEDKKIILIDPGHGGFDGGAKSKNGTIEKDINISISLKLRDELVSRGYEVAMTREDDKGLEEHGNTIKEKKREDLKKRTTLKKETNCDAFISIHQNMFPQSKCFGAQVWYASNDLSSKLAINIQDSLKASTEDGNKRVAKPAGDAYLILRDKYEKASVLVECGFLSNPDEECRLKTDEFQNKIVKGIADGVDNYFKVQ